MKTGAISALAVALSLGLLTTAEAEEWTGPYLTFGVVAASADLNSSTETASSTGGDSSDTTAYAAVGYDWAVGGLTFGILADIDGLGATDDVLTEGKGFSSEADWFATLRGRVGMPVTDQMQLYASAGVAFMGVSTQSVGLFSTTDRGSVKGTVVGIGMEQILSPGRHLSVEYLHADFDREFFHSGELVLEPVVNELRVGYTFRF